MSITARSSLSRQMLSKIDISSRLNKDSGPIAEKVRSTLKKNNAHNHQINYRIKQLQDNMHEDTESFNSKFEDTMKQFANIKEENERFANKFKATRKWRALREKKKHNFKENPVEEYLKALASQYQSQGYKITDLNSSNTLFTNNPLIINNREINKLYNGIKNSKKGVTDKFSLYLNHLNLAINERSNLKSKETMKENKNIVNYIQRRSIKHFQPIYKSPARKFTKENQELKNYNTSVHAIIAAIPENEVKQVVHSSCKDIHTLSRRFTLNLQATKRNLLEGGNLSIRIGNDSEEETHYLKNQSLRGCSNTTSANATFYTNRNFKKSSSLIQLKNLHKGIIEGQYYTPSSNSIISSLIRQDEKGNESRTTNTNINFNKSHSSRYLSLRKRNVEKKAESPEDCYYTLRNRDASLSLVKNSSKKSLSGERGKYTKHDPIGVMRQIESIQMLVDMQNTYNKSKLHYSDIGKLYHSIPTLKVLK